MNVRTLAPKDLYVPGRVLIERHQLLQKIPLSTRTLDEMEKRGEFPKRFAISHTKVAWDLAEIDAWIAARKTLDEQVPSPAGKQKRQARD
ncbi:AlpA family phage regulatory protein [Duganella sp. FT135W]|uniref:AlpA family phage regulatory protein n=1 Tax=Duganella flavida TaxID=2692175 RepID=A0A6L8K5V0_9BURK|nr:AlpA family phage regulatory protein [Duganella flavida]MYM22600.1 AlpA family phage regulatory protein [Duganella flavida]